MLKDRYCYHWGFGFIIPLALPCFASSCVLCCLALSCLVLPSLVALFGLVFYSLSCLVSSCLVWPCFCLALPRRFFLIQKREDKDKDRDKARDKTRFKNRTSFVEPGLTRETTKDTYKTNHIYIRRISQTWKDNHGTRTFARQDNHKSRHSHRYDIPYSHATNTA